MENINNKVREKILTYIPDTDFNTLMIVAAAIDNLKRSIKKEPEEITYLYGTILETCIKRVKND